MKLEGNSERFDAASSEGGGGSRLVEEALMLAYGRPASRAVDTAVGAASSASSAERGQNETPDKGTEVAPGTANEAVPERDQSEVATDAQNEGREDSNPDRAEPRTPIRRAADMLPGSDAPLVPGEYTTRTVMVGGVPRPYNVFVPHSYNPSNGDVVMALDGLTIRNPNGGMATVNGWNATAERHGFLAVYPQPGTRVSGQVNSWNPGLLNPAPEPAGGSAARGTERLGSRAGDDVDYLNAVINDMRRLATVNQLHAVTFSEGALPIQHALARLPERTFDTVTYVGGTTLGDTPMPRPGTRTLVIHGDQDGTLPYRGGAAGRTRLLELLGHRAASQSSRPDLLVARAAEANNLDPQKPVIDTTNFRMRRFLSANPDNNTDATEYLVRGGGHSWFGRPTGGGNESLLSRFNGPTIGRDQFDTNEIIARHFGLDRPIAIRRQLGRVLPSVGSR